VPSHPIGLKMAISPSSSDAVLAARTHAPDVVPPGDSTLWMAEGACHGKQAMDWFPTEEFSGSEEVKAVCGRCRVVGPCLSYALAHHELGIWRGTTERERRVLRKLPRLRASAAASSEHPEGQCLGVA
jgi:WhiB family redox-sensing transcriptional regulator